MSNKGKICFIIPTLQQGGMERVMSELANFADSNGYDATIICLTSDIIQYTLNPSVKIILPPYKYSGGLIPKLKVLNYLYKTLKAIKPDRVLSFSEIFNPLSILACRLNKLDVYISDRSNPLKKHKASDEFFRRNLYPLAKGIIAQTNIAKDAFLKKKYNNNIAVIQNPLKALASADYNAALKCMVTVGSLSVRKNPTELVRIFNKTGNKEWKLYFVGEGPLRGELEALINELGLQEQVFLTGSSNNVDEWLAKCSIFAFTSSSEGFPNALSEAMAFPLACISYDCPTGPKELIEDNVNGFLIPLGDTEMYSKKLSILMNDQALRTKFTDKSVLNRGKYSSEVICRQFIDFIFAN
jgi:GalNAc-alpha-(1->4)-GalNAc-alpha-(1->3)-diNAcBac-PP-undecaprenol alpha-1,4-N-acetyl-D-galactosaminyltransferase